MKTFSSYAVKTPTQIAHYASHPIGGHRMYDPYSCALKSRSHIVSAKACAPETKTRAIFLLAAKKPPYNVYGNPFYDYAGYGNVFSVNKDGAMESNIQNYEYSPESAIHGMVFDSTETYLYSADMWANRIWAHRKDNQTGKLTLVGSVDAPAPGDHPRWVEMHPSGTYLYVLMEAGNNLAVYVIDQETHMPVFTQLTYPLIPPGMQGNTYHRLFTNNPLLTDSYSGLNKKLYRADVVFLSHSNSYLFATSRANPTGLTGYISAFSLGPAGNIVRQLCMNPTPTSGGHSNAVSPCPWSDEWLALTDDQEGWVEVYRWKDEWMARVAHCDVKEPGFGMNAIWYD
jgi:carboxy-cis,cis-muconate cyclase